MCGLLNTLKPGHMKKLSRWRIREGIKAVFCSDVTLAGTGCKTLACALAVRVLQYSALQLTGVSLITYFIYFSIWIPIHEKFQIFDSQGLHFSY